MVKKKERPLKRSKTGIEAEFHIIDDKGYISNDSSKVISAIRHTHKNVDVSKEVGMNMIEFGCYPDVPAVNPTIDLIDSIQKSLDICRENGLKLYPFATYPGKFQPMLTKGLQYDIKKKIFGYPKIENAARATGFHHHYSLPKGVFDAREKLLKLMRKSKLERSMMASYNFEIAADPALTLYAQSSPLLEGQYLAKDSRTLIYRGGRKLRYMGGVYATLQQIGGLPPYKQTATDLLISLSRRWIRWEREVKKVDPSVDFNVLYPFKLDIGWHPVKINKHGTLEQRGMDINYMSVVVGITVMLKYCLKKIQRDFLEVIPADFAIDEAFKVEGNVMYIPPHTYVRNNLQLWSAYHGYEKDEMLNYAKRLYLFARSATPRSYYRIIRPVYDMIESKMSVSDSILAYARKRGYIVDGKIGNSDAALLASYYADTFPKDIEKTREALLKVASL